MSEFGRWNSSSFLTKLFLLDKAAGIVLGVYYDKRYGGLFRVETRNAARVSTAGAIILTAGLVISALLVGLGYAPANFSTGMMVVLFVSAVGVLVVSELSAKHRVFTGAMSLLGMALVLSIIAAIGEAIVPSVRLTMLIVAVVFLNAGVLWWILERRKRREENYMMEVSCDDKARLY